MASFESECIVERACLSLQAFVLARRLCDGKFLADC